MMNVIKFSPDSKPQLATLYERLMRAVEESRDTNITFAEVIGILELVKHDLMKD